MAHEEVDSYAKRNSGVSPHGASPHGTSSSNGISTSDNNMISLAEVASVAAMQGLSWQRINQTISEDNEIHWPSARSSHTLTVVGSNAFLIGGLCYQSLPLSALAYATANLSNANGNGGNSMMMDTEGEVTGSNEVFRLNLGSKAGCEWTRISGSNGYAASPAMAPPGMTSEIDHRALISNPPLPPSNNDGEEMNLLPPARWKHTATLFQSTQIVVFGGFHSPEHRLNDLWVFDTLSLTWSQPNPKHNQESRQSCSLTHQEWTNVPSPRASHTATIIGELIYVFGGYGGLGYSRRDLDDLYTLNPVTWQWNRLLTKGTGPEKRSGHQACAVEKKLYIFGGANSLVQFDDMFILDTELDPPVWSKLAYTLPQPTWHMSACSVIAIPTWKLFLFGGVGGQLSDTDRLGRTLSETAILDTGVGRWQTPKIAGEAPEARSDAVLAYDAKGGRLLVFGGWADNWLKDLYALDIGNVVGPPYAITEILPSFGPVTGGTEVSIYGIDFMPSSSIIVRFGNSRNYVDVMGVYVSQTEVTCIAPVGHKFLSPIGNQNNNITNSIVDVRISFEGESFTTTFQRFSYFPITNANTCIMFGPGLLSGCATSEEVSFVIQARDDQGMDRTTGGDEFSVVITLLSGGEGMDISGNGTESVRLMGILIQDQGNGTYIVTYKVKYPGKYSVAVDFLGTFGGKAGALRGSGVSVEFSSKSPRENNQMTGELVLNALRNDLSSLQKFTEDVSKSILVRVRDESWSSDEQIAALMRIKETLLLVETRADEINLLVERSECVIKHLTSQHLLMDSQEEALRNSRYLWEKIQRETPQLSNKITPMMRSHHSKIKSDIGNYETQIRTLLNEISQGVFYIGETGGERAMAALKSMEQRYTNETVIFTKLSHVARIFDCFREMETTAKLMEEVNVTLSELRALWETEEKISRSLEEVSHYEWHTYDTEGLEDLAKSWSGLVRKLPRGIRSSDAFQCLDRRVKEHSIICPILTSLRSSVMRDRHWEEVMNVIEQEFILPSMQPQMQLGMMLNLRLHRYASEVDEVTDKAQKEAKHELSLRSLESVWETASFVMSFYKDTDVPLLRLEDDIVEQLEADQMAVQSIVGSRYAHFKPAALVWQKTLGQIADVYSLLGDIQRTWSYLEPLFIGSEEVKKELPEDAKRFSAVDTQVRNLLQKAWKQRVVKNVCSQPGLLERLQAIEIDQEKCKKSLSDFLDGKRRQFPRFYFMSESDLLTLLSNSSSPARVLTLIDKILLSTSSIELEQNPAVAKDRPMATGWIAGVGTEKVRFDPPVQLFGKAELYLQTLLDAQIFTLSKALSASMTRYPESVRSKWVIQRSTGGAMLDPAQIILLVSGIDFVTQVERAMSQCVKGDARSLMRTGELIRTQLGELITLTQGKLTREERQRVMCMITLDAHNRDILDTLLAEKALSPTDFQWQSKLRPSFIGNLPKDVTHVASMAEFRICDATFEYGFEYLGNGPRLVVTPLTDRIYVTATQALHLKMGCAPAGPAGTGKTETTKDLASALGKCCYVFNCSPEMDYQSMGNIFKGLSASGSWGCFDEFNRLIPEVLSVCSVQFKAVCDSLRSYMKNEPTTHRVTIEGDTVGLDPTLGVFITMNPGYLGRSELPEGLKALFRPITVVVPDLVLICENMLMSEGFLSAKLLASKFYSLYSLLAQLLSKQLHYDWGLRAVKSVLVVAGQLKRSEPNLPEDSLLMRALRDFNIPKIVQQDEVVFFGLLNDLFPGLNPPRVFDESLSESISLACESSNLYADPFFSLKVMQLDELLDIRHCVFIMGPPGAGKTAAWKTLLNARNHQYSSKGSDTRVKAVDLNPKVMPTEELYGHISLSTREWKDGLLSTLMRDLGRIPNEHPKWLILDGDLDANWIESMNSVMDDNKMLTLASNERIPLKSHMRMVFEIRDLRFATPATVSRAGILFISTDEGSQWRSIIGSWVRKQSQELMESSDRERVHALFEKYLPSCLRFFASEVNGVVQYNDVSLAICVLRLLETLLTRSVIADSQALEVTFVFGLLWGLGSVLSVTDDGVDQRKVFSDWFRSKFGKTVKIPARDTVFDYWLDHRTLKFESWKSSPAFREVQFDSSAMDMSVVTVPTAETASISFWLDMLVKSGTQVMLAGPAGTGKTQLVNGLLNSLNPEHHISLKVNMNFYTSASILLTTLESVLQKRTGTTYGPAGSAKLVYFIDDLNLPEVDPYGTQSAIALLRQHIDYGHWYDSVKLTQKTVDDCQYVATLNPTAGSFLINPRLQRHFTTFAVGMPTATSLLTIYQTFLDGHLLTQQFSPAITSLSSTLIKSALAVHKEVSEAFRKTAANFHYEFNIRHLANIFQGLLVATPTLFTEGEKFVCLWLHESERVYGDRLVNSDDLLRLRSILQTQAKKFFPQYNVVRYYLSGGGVKADPLVFCHFADGLPIGSGNGGGNNDEMVYDQATSVAELRVTLESALAEYNEISAAMNLVLFDDAVLHVARIVRIIRQTGGHALLVGVGGSGKQSLSRLSAFVCGLTVRQIAVNHSYGLADFKADLQSMYTKAGVKQEGVLFLLTDTQIINERFLVYMNDLLSSGHIPDLYTKDERDTLISQLTSKAKSAGYSADPSGVWTYFIDRVRENLHVALCFSPVGPNLRVRARRFPALASCTVIDWFQPWPEQALASVGKKFLSTADLGAPEVRLAVEAFMPSAFLGVNEICSVYAVEEGKHVYTTPKSYLEMLSLYTGLLDSTRGRIDRDINRLQHGIEKLETAAADVVELEANLKVMLASAEEKRQVAEEIAANVARERAIVESENALAVIEAEKVATIQSEVSLKQLDASKDLALAEPALEGAMQALQSLDRKDLGNCKTMAKPPPGVEDIFGAVMVLLAGLNPNIIVQKSGRVREKERTWDASKKALLGNVNGFLEELLNFKTAIDSGTVPEINWKEIRPFLVLEHFSPEVIEKRNSAAAGLCSWVINIVNYYDIVLQVEPKRRALKTANEQLERANSQLQEVRERVTELERKLNLLTDAYNKAEISRKEAQETAERGKLKLELANRLTTALGSEKIRWSNGIGVLQKEHDLLVGDCLLTASFISYAGPFTKAYRESLFDEILSPLITTPSIGQPIASTSDMEPFGLVCSEAEIAEYQTQGLPADKSSAENAAIVLHSARYPLLVDPQLQGISWIKRREGTRLQIGRLGEKNLIPRLLKAIEEGLPFLIENMGEEIDPPLLPIIARVSIKRGSRRFLQVGDSEVEISSQFRLYLHTKLSNPHYPPEIQAETTLVNFTVTQDGLEEQLLSLVVKYERDDLAAQRSAVLMQQNLITIRVQQLEDQILRRLADATGDITENRELIEELELSKKISQEIAQQFLSGQELSRRLQATSENYRSVAHRGALLFTFLTSLRKVHGYYIYSLASFVSCFLRGVAIANGGDVSEALRLLGSNQSSEKNNENSSNETTSLDELGAQISARELEIAEKDAAAKSVALDGHLDKLKDSITEVLWDFVRTGLFEKDKSTALALLTFRILTDEGRVSAEMVDILICGRIMEDPIPRGPELAGWLSEVSWSRLKALEEDAQAVLPDLGERVSNDAEEWEEWSARPDPENFPMPGEYATLDDLTRLALLRIFRPDRLQPALFAFAKKGLGDRFLRLMAPPTLPRVFHFTAATAPCLFMLYAGVDPTPWVESLGAEQGITYEKQTLVNISLGQGQEARAEAALERLAQNGGWLFLQNVHLMQTWLPRLVLQLETFTPHPNFRLFLTAEPPVPGGAVLPEALVQSSLVMTNEPSSDLAANVDKAWATLAESPGVNRANYATGPDAANIDTTALNHSLKSCLTALVFFHGLVLGRRRFGAQGWSRAYGFSTGDLRISADIIVSNLVRYAGAISKPTARSSGSSKMSLPWQDLRYIIGEILYGGHITDYFDRRTALTYLQELFAHETLTLLAFAPHFERSSNEMQTKQATPAATAALIESALWVAPDVRHLETGVDGVILPMKLPLSLPSERPTLYGLPANVEIRSLSRSGEALFETLRRIEVGADSSTTSAGSGSALKDVLLDLLRRCPEPFDLLDLSQRAKEHVDSEAGPFALVLVQEAVRMSTLLSLVTSSLEELLKGLNGQLNMTPAMEDLALCLELGKVPGQILGMTGCDWMAAAWPSNKNLFLWYIDLGHRRAQLATWASNFIVPMPLWLPGLVNPLAYLTAIKQVTARRRGIALDTMTLQTHITAYRTVNDVTSQLTTYPEDGMLVHGLLLEGACWSSATGDDDGDEAPFTVSGVPCNGYLAEARLKQLLNPTPVIFIQALPVQPEWLAEGVGYLRRDRELYECPVYMTATRGPTFVFLAYLRTRDPVQRWILAGVALLMQSDD